jgi:hypothetical protein
MSKSLFIDTEILLRVLVMLDLCRDIISFVTLTSARIPTDSPQNHQYFLFNDF